MVCVDHYGIKPLKKVDQDPGCSDCMRRCDSSSFECFPTKKIEMRQHHTFSTPYLIYLAYCTKYGKQGVRLTENWKTRYFSYKSYKKWKSCSIVKLLYLKYFVVIIYVIYIYNIYIYIHIYIYIYIPWINVFWKLFSDPTHY